MTTNHSRRDRHHHCRRARGHRRHNTRSSMAQAETQMPKALPSKPARLVRLRTAHRNHKGPDPERISLCHCMNCQKQSGSAFAIQATFPKEQVTIEGKSTVWKFPIEGAPPVTYRNCSRTGATFYFCPKCGSTVYYVLAETPDNIGVQSRRFRRPDVSAAHDFRLRRVPVSLGNERRGPSDAGGHHD